MLRRYKIIELTAYQWSGASWMVLNHQLVPYPHMIFCLGVHFQLCPTRSKKAKLKKFCALWPSDRSTKRIRQRIREVIGRRSSLSLETLISELTPVIRGWNNYHKKTRPIVKRLIKLNAFVRERIRIFLKRKYSDQKPSWITFDFLYLFHHCFLKTFS